MGQKAHPIGNRVGIIRGWESNWYSKKDTYAQKLIEDNKIRAYLRKRNPRVGISKIVIERTLGKIIVTIHTSKPGIVIGKGGVEVESIKAGVKKLVKNKDVQLNILEVKKPELDAHIVAENIAHQLENRVNFKRTAKMSLASTMRAGAEGIKIKLGGRLGGAEIARSENYKEGRVPLHTFRMDIDYASIFALTVYGKIGIKVWICRGEVLSRRELNMNFVPRSSFGNNNFGGGRRRQGGGFDKRDGGSDRRQNRFDRRGSSGGNQRQGGGGNYNAQNSSNRPKN